MAHIHRILFMGSDAICLPVLNFLREGAAQEGARYTLVGIVSQPDRPKGRGKRLQGNPVTLWAREHGYPLLQPTQPDEHLVEWIRGEAIDLGLVMAYGHLLKRALREAPIQGLLNFHASLLPDLRGASPVETAVALGRKETGVCLMKIAARMDAGAVGACEKIPIQPTATSADVRAELGSAAARLLARSLDQVLNKELPFTAQPEAEATYCRKLEKADGGLDFTASAEVLANRIRGLQPWPGTFFKLGDDTIKVFAGKPSAHSTEGQAPTAPPGTVMHTNGGLHIATGDGVLIATELQRPGGKRLPADDFLRGYPIPAGTVLARLPMPKLLKTGLG